MRTVLIVSLVFALGYTLSRPVMSTNWALLGVRWIFLSGAELLLVGYLVGPEGIGLLTPSTLDRLDPLVQLAVAWAGLLFGMQFTRREVRVYPARRYGLAFLQALITGALVGAIGGVVLAWMFPTVSDGLVLRGAVILGVCSSVTSPTSLHYVATVLGYRGRFERLLRFVAGVDGIPAVIVLGGFTGLFHVATTQAGGPLAGWQWLAIATGGGCVLGVLFSVLASLELSRDELLLVVLGMVVLAGGLAYSLELSALYMSFVMGLTVANTGWIHEEIHKVVGYAEHAIYLSLLLLAGAALQLDRSVAVLSALLVGLRLVAKVFGNLPWRWFKERDARVSWLGAGLLSQGGIAMVLAIDFELLYRNDPVGGGLMRTVVSAVLVAVLLNEALSPFGLRLALGRAEARGGVERQEPTS